MEAPCPTDREIDELLDAARAARANAHAPYSGFPVGAAVLANGGIFVGVNVENASYPLSVCAERNAAAAAVAAGARGIRAVAIVADAARPATPCGGCRQVLAEFGPNMVVVSESSGGRRARWSLDALLPEPFGPGATR
jgi:cytidine deaminase